MSLNDLLRGTTVSVEDQDIVSELQRFNDNFERYLDHLKVPKRPLTDSSIPTHTIEPVSELEMAVEEWKEMTGRSNG